MASTGEVACYGENKYEAYLKAILSAGFRVPKKCALLSGDIKEEFVPYAKKLVTMGLELAATPDVAELLKRHKMKFRALTLEQARVELRLKSIDWTIAFPFAAEKTDESRVLRRSAIDFACPITTNPQLAMMTITSLEKVGNDFTIKGWDEYFPEELANSALNS